MPVGAVNYSGRTALELVRRVRGELKLNTICGASNVSFGLPDRTGLNAAFLAMLIGAGLTSGIVNPLHREVMTAITGSEVLAGLDAKCKRWIKRCRRLQAAAQGQDAKVA
jgi:5-methyltetrahydrofolate--homocysteine methyltransferase